MRTIKFSIVVKVGVNHAKETKVNWRELLPATYKKLVELYYLLDQRIERYVLEKGAALEPTLRSEHDLLCDCRKCVPPFEGYVRHLKKGLVWDKQGHLK